MKRSIKIYLILLFFTGFIAKLSFANNLTVIDVYLTNPNAANGTIDINMDVRWYNGWRNQINYDAVWLFVKYSTDSGTTWNHATLKTAGTNPSDTSGGTSMDVDIIVPSDKKGAFLQRAATGEFPGTVTAYDVRLCWDWQGDGLSASSTAIVKVFAIEMVYIPPGGYYLGDGNSTNESTYAFHSATDNTAMQAEPMIGSNYISCDASANDDIDTDHSIYIQGWMMGFGITGNNSFPNGLVNGSSTKNFYLMKHEITEGQWVDFFNTLTAAQRLQRDITDATGKNSDAVSSRNTVSWTGSGSATTTRPYRACSYLSWMDVCAYADWAALRPMTELEYEKACRGTNASVYGEYAWGTNSYTSAATISGSESGTETITTSGANCNYSPAMPLSGGDGGYGPLRVGIFATSTSTRVTSGAGYYGNMELAGNLHEYVVSVGNSFGRAFQGTHGDGVLTTTASYEGNATNTDWPGIAGTQARGVTGAAGSGKRGGSWVPTVPIASISNRNYASGSASTRTQETGGRCARTEP